MNTTRVFIDKGQLIETVYGGPECQFEYHVVRPLFAADDSPLTGSYRGEAARVTENGVSYLVIESGINVDKIRIGDATQESVERARGYFFGMAQKRQTAPRGKSDAFIDGWRSAWSERRPLKF